MPVFAHAAFDGVCKMPFLVSAPKQLGLALLAAYLFTAPAFAADSAIDSGIQHGF